MSVSVFAYRQLDGLRMLPNALEYRGNAHPKRARGHFRFDWCQHGTVMVDREEMVLCRTPTLGKQGVRIAKWKYNRVRQAILGVLPEAGEGIEFRRLAEWVKASLSEEESERLGSISWYTTTVKLELEVRGEIERLPASKPQRLRCRRAVQ
jgi:hypothetical protein